MNGTETKMNCSIFMFLFYSSVILNGTETEKLRYACMGQFYSSVILNGTETVLQGSSDDG